MESWTGNPEHLKADRSATDTWQLVNPDIRAPRKTFWKKKKRHVNGSRRQETMLATHAKKKWVTTRDTRKVCESQAPAFEQRGSWRWAAAMSWQKMQQMWAYVVTPSRRKNKQRLKPLQRVGTRGKLLLTCSVCFTGIVMFRFWNCLRAVIVTTDKCGISGGGGDPCTKEHVDDSLSHRILTHRICTKFFSLDVSGREFFLL